MIIGDTLGKNRRFYPDRMAVTDGRKRLTYREFVDRVFQLMNVLFALNLARGDFRSLAHIHILGRIDGQ